MKRKRGRPAVPEDRQLVSLSAMVTPQQKAFLEAGAARNAASLSHYVRSVISFAMKSTPAKNNSNLF